MGRPFHSLLRRQLKRHRGDPDLVPYDWRAFVDAVDQAYRQSDVDRLMIERSLDLSSEELSDANSQMREAVSALRQGQLELESRVQRALDEQRRLEDQLRQAQKMEAIGRLAGGVAHDFNNLLVIITGEAELLLESPLDQEAGRAIREIVVAAESAAGLTRQLLAFSRQQTLTPTVIDINQLVTSTGTLVNRLIGEDIELVIDVDADVGAVSADANQLQQVLLNLAVNARDAMPDGGRFTITTRFDRIEQQQATTLGLAPGAYVRLTVADNGAGMSAEVRARVFEPFFTTKGQQHGTGLGLSSAYGIIKQSHGHIAVESAPGCGSTFRIWLPRVAEVPQPSPPEPAAATGSGVVLVVEDQDPVRRTIRARLEKAGFVVVDCADGRAALAAADAMPRIDLLLTDLVMPLMGGRELAMRLEQSRPGLKVLYMTGYVNDVVVQEEVRSGRRRLLQKPFRGERLVAEVQAAMEPGLIR
jgi:signal transduction histidine kinase/CheY-like chemotaxis protein